MVRNRSMWVAMLAVLAVLAVTAAACGGAKASSSAASQAGAGTSGGTPIAATVRDFSIAVTPVTTAAGKITFQVANSGPSTHEFVVLRTNDAAGALPVTNGKAEEEGQEISHIGEVEDIAPGTTKSLSLTLTPGSYVLLCNIPGHYQAGMHASFTIS